MKKSGFDHADITHIFEKQVLDSIIRWFAVVGLLALGPSVFAAYVQGLWLVLAVDLIVYAVILVLAFTNAFAYPARAAIVVSGTGMVGVVVLFFTGQEGAGFMWLMASVVFSASFGTPRIAYSLVTALGLLTIAYAVGVSIGYIESELSGPIVTVIGANVLVVISASTKVVTQLVSRLRTLTSHQNRLLGQLSDELQQNMEIQRSLQQTLADKRAGLHELDHRVRNNIQVMMSLTSFAEHDPSPEALLKLRLRVDSMATVQQLIDPTGNALDIDVSLLTFRTYQKVQAAVPQRRCEFEWTDGRPPEAMYLPADRAVHLALACTEIFMNSLQHADSTAAVRIRAGMSVSGTLLRLELSDNGSAVSSGVDYLSHPGLTLIQAAVEQCGGEVQPGSKAGFAHVLTIPLSNDTELHG